jgi:drug/metabolite transporter (DMT)-like permease
VIRWPSARVGAWTGLIGFAGLTAHFCLTKALTLAPATVVVPIDFARLPLIAIVGMLVFNETLDIYVFAGALVIFAANFLNIRYGNPQQAPIPVQNNN